MKKMPLFKHVTLASALILACVGTAEGEWLKTYSTMDLDTGFSVHSAQGGYYQSVFGNKQTKFSSLALIDELGIPKWRREIATGGIDQFFSYELANGQLFVNGTTQATTTTDPTQPVWAKFNVNRATGQLTPVFTMSYSNNVKFFNTFEDTASHKIFGQASIKKNSSSYDIMVNQINPTSGQPVWAKVFDIGTMDFVNLIQPATQNRYILAGETSTKTDFSDGKVIIGFLDSQGIPVAESFKKYGAEGASNHGYLVPISNGNYLLVGTTSASTVASYRIRAAPHSSVFVVKLDQNLQILWKQSFNAATDTNLSASSAFQNKDGTFIINASQAPAFSFTNPLASFNQHPVILKLASNGSLLDSKRYEFGESDSGSFIASPDGGYLFQGTITNLSQRSDGVHTVYGKFNAQLQPIWTRQLSGENSFYSAITPTTDGFWINGQNTSAQTKTSDLLLGQLNINGDIPGCPEIDPITPNVVNAGISNVALTWFPKAATVNVNKAIPLNAYAIQINNQTAALPTVNTLCNY